MHLKKSMKPGFSYALKYLPGDKLRSYSYTQWSLLKDNDYYFV